MRGEKIFETKVVFCTCTFGCRAVLYVIIPRYVSLISSFSIGTCIDRCVFILGNVCMYRN